MPDSPADERIKRFLALQGHDAAAVEDNRQRGEKLGQERNALINRVREKWMADAQVIAGILTELEQKLAPAGLHVRFQDEGAHGKGIAGGRIIGQFSGRPVDLRLSVLSDGKIESAKGQALGHMNTAFLSATKFSVLTADRGEYEALILDLLGVG